MNCKQGDIAYIVLRPCDRPEYDWADGLIVRCLSRWIMDSKYWVVEPRIEGPDRTHGAVVDACLRPLRNPGDDEVDEMIVKRREEHRKAMEEVREFVNKYLG